MVNIHVVLIAYALDITPLVKSIAGDDVTFHAFLHSQQYPAANSVYRLSTDDAVPNFNLYNYRENRGLARSWNEGIVNAREQDADVIVIANDDIEATRLDLLTLADAAMSHPEAGVIVCEGLNGTERDHIILNHGFCAINPIAIERVGFYDENFFPVYFEDTDYSRRCGLSGVPFFNAGETGVVHLGSTSIKTIPELRAQNDLTFHRNYEYYVRKWGGGPSDEIFRLPFNSENFGWQIAASQRHDPYPGWGRKDKEIVKV